MRGFIHILQTLRRTFTCRYCQKTIDPTKTEYITASGKQLLTLLQSSAAVIPVPLLQDAIGVALNTIEVCKVPAKQQLISLSLPTKDVGPFNNVEGLLVGAEGYRNGRGDPWCGRPVRYVFVFPFTTVANPFSFNPLHPLGLRTVRITGTAVKHTGNYR